MVALFSATMDGDIEHRVEGASESDYSLFYFNVRSSMFDVHGKIPGFPAAGWTQRGRRNWPGRCWDSRP